MAEPVVSSIADRYTLVRELGRGGMGAVWLARDEQHDRLVAIKLLHPELAGVVGSDRFLREVRVTAQLQHPNIVPMLDSGVIRRGDGTELPWYAMPYHRGGVASGQNDPGGAASTRRCTPHRRPGRAGAPRGAPAGDCPPRHQAGEHAPVSRLGLRGGLRHRQGDRRDRCCPADQHRPDGRHPGLHESRAGHRRPGGCPQRSVQPRHGLVRDADGRTALRRPHRAGHRGSTAFGVRPANSPSPARGASFGRACRAEGLGALAGRSLCRCGCFPRSASRHHAPKRSGSPLGAPVPHDVDRGGTPGGSHDRRVRVPAALVG